MVEFNVDRMRAMVKKDKGLAFFLEHMKKNNVGSSGSVPATEEKLLEVLFNSEVLENSCMIRQYNRVKVAA